VARFEQGLWTSASPCQRCIMVLGGLCLLIGCLQVCLTENAALLSHAQTALLGQAVVEMQCNGTLPRERLDSSVPVHLKGCPVFSANLSAASAGLQGLGAMKRCLPHNGVRAAWLRINLETYSGSDRVWRSTHSVFNVSASDIVSDDIRVGRFSVARNLAVQIPGSVVPLS